MQTPSSPRRSPAIHVWPLAAALLALAAPALRAANAPVSVKLGTLVPKGTSYYTALAAMGEQWKKAPGGGVKLTIYGGNSGSERDMVSMFPDDNLQAGLLSVEGLNIIEPAVSALQFMPLSFRSLAEVDYVGEKLQPKLARLLLAKGYVVLFWCDSGWVRFFSKQPVQRPDDLRKLKVFAWAGDANETDVWRAAGFKPVPLETSAVAQGLLSGTIEAVPLPPFFALAGQADATAKHMLEINWAPLVGALIIRQKTWEKIPAPTREALLAAAAEAGRTIKAAGRKESDDSVAAMAKRGLVVHAMTPEANAEWLALAEKMNPVIRGKIVPADIFDEAQALLKEFRTGGGKPQP